MTSVQGLVGNKVATFEYFPCLPMHCTSFELLFAFVCVFLQGHPRTLLAWEQSRWSFLQFVSVSLPALLRQTASYQPIIQTMPQRKKKWQSCNPMEKSTAFFKTQAARRETRPHHSGKVCCLPLKVENARQQESEPPPSRTQSHFQFQSWKGCLIEAEISNILY